MEKITEVNLFRLNSFFNVLKIKITLIFKLPWPFPTATANQTMISNEAQEMNKQAQATDRTTLKLYIALISMH